MLVKYIHVDYFDWILLHFVLDENLDWHCMIYVSFDMHYELLIKLNQLKVYKFLNEGCICMECLLFD